MKTLKTLVVSVLVSGLLLLPLALSALNLVLEMRDDTWLFEMHQQIITLQDDMKGLKSTTKSYHDVWKTASDHLIGTSDSQISSLEDANKNLRQEFDEYVVEQGRLYSQISHTTRTLETWVVQHVVAEEAKKEKEKKSE